MKVSVVIATYNGERFLGEQLTSLMKQKLLPDEVVICDDSPNDLTQKVIEQFLQKLNIQYYHNEKTLGVNNNFM